MKPVPLRHLLTIAIAIVCTILSISNYSTAVSRQDAEAGVAEFGVPPPPTGAFPEAFLTAPGYLAALPLIIVAGVLGSSWLFEFAIILGATFFWYCAGWWIDCVRGAVEQDTPPRFVLIHFSALRVVSAVLFPIFLLEGFRVGNYFCVVGKPPFWPEMLMYGVMMVWITIGASFAWQNFWQSHNHATLSLFAEQRNS